MQEDSIKQTKSDRNMKRAQTNGDPTYPMGSYSRDRYLIRFKAVDNPNFVANAQFIGSFSPNVQKMLGIQKTNTNSKIATVAMPRICAKCKCFMQLQVISKGNINKGTPAKVGYKCYSESCQIVRASKHSQKIKEKHDNLEKKEKAIQLTNV